MKKKYEQFLLIFLLILLASALPVIKNKKIIVNLPTTHSAIVNAIKKNKDLSSNLTLHKSKRFFSKDIKSKEPIQKENQKNLNQPN